MLHFNKKPSIAMETDQGKDVEATPGFGVVGGKHIKDHHHRLDEKKRDREEKSRKESVR